MKTRRGVYHRNLMAHGVLGLGAVYLRSAATYTRHALQLVSRDHQPAQHLAPLASPHQPSSSIDGLGARLFPEVGHHALLSDFGQNSLRTVNLFSAPNDLEQ